MKFGLTIFATLAIACPLWSQNFGFQEPFHLVDLGNGAKAIGMGGAVVAIADDLSALYWNPAGLSSRPGFRAQFDGLYTNGNETFQVTTYRSGTSQHDYSVSGFQPQSVALTYQFQRGELVLGPSFSWSRASLSLTDYKMDTAATGHMSYNNFVLESDYSSLENVHFDRTGEDIYAFGFSFRKANRFSLGGAWNVLGGEVNRTQSIYQTAEGTFESYPTSGSFSSVLNIEEQVREQYSGGYGNIGVLYKATPRFSIGGTVRTGYKRRVLQIRTVSFNYDRSGVAPVSDHRTATFDPETLEFNVPWEFSGGVLISFTRRVQVGSSLAYADYAFGQGYNYPTLRDGNTYQSSLVQWRNGVDYRVGESWNLRAGWILDNQPYSKQYYPSQLADDSVFHAFTFGAGWEFGKGAVDFAYMHETGSAHFGRRLGGISDHDVELSVGHLNHNRFLFSVIVQP